MLVRVMTACGLLAALLGAHAGARAQLLDSPADADEASAVQVAEPWLAAGVPDCLRLPDDDELRALAADSAAIALAEGLDGQDGDGRSHAPRLVLAFDGVVAPTPAAQRALQRWLPRLRTALATTPGTRIDISGSPAASDYDVDALALLHARVARAWLIAAGLPPAQLRLSTPMSVARGGVELRLVLDADGG